MTEAEALNPKSPQTEEFGEFGELKTKKISHAVDNTNWKQLKCFDIISRFGEPHFKSKMFLNYNFLKVVYKLDIYVTYRHQLLDKETEGLKPIYFFLQNSRQLPPERVH